MNQSDPTDNALAAIASILDQPHTPPTLAPERAPVEEEAAEPPAEEVPADPPQIEANGYFRVGPGPIAALRFKWTVREDSGRYYVDETVGENSTPVVSGPMEGNAAIKFVDDRESEARQRFEDLKQEMAGRAAVSNLARKDSGEEIWRASEQVAARSDRPERLPSLGTSTSTDDW